MSSLARGTLAIALVTALTMTVVAAGPPVQPAHEPPERPEPPESEPPEEGEEEAEKEDQSPEAGPSPDAAPETAPDAPPARETPAPPTPAKTPSTRTPPAVQPTSIQPPATFVQTGVEASAAKPVWYPFGGTLLLSQSVGTGTFTDGPAKSPYYNIALVLRPHVVLLETIDLRVNAELGFDVNAVDNAASDRDAAGQVMLWDIDLGVSATALRLDFDTWPTSQKPARLELGVAFDLIFPTSLASQTASQHLGMRLELEALFSPFDWLEVGYALGATKNFNRFPNKVVNAANFTQPPIARSGSAAGVDTLLIATGQGVTEWGVTNSLHLGFHFFDRVTLAVHFGTAHAFTYLRDIPKDTLSSPFAQANRGQSEVMTGSLELSVDIMNHLAVAIGTVTEQAPYSPDGETLRSPFWDATNGAANRQVIYLDITGSM